MSSCGDRYVVLDVRAGTKVELWRTDSNGSNRAKLAENVLGSNCSPDGEWVLYATRFKFYRLPVEGGAPTEVADAFSPSDASPAISQDGKWIAYRYVEGPLAVESMAVIPAGGGSASHVLPLPIRTSGLRWSPDQKGLQFLLTRNGATNVSEQRLKGGEPRQITNFTSGRIFDFSWSRDGKQLYLAKGEYTSDVILIGNFR